jgi:hypothetical protein
MLRPQTKMAPVGAMTSPEQAITKGAEEFKQRKSD